MKSTSIPKATIERLAAYLQVLGIFKREGVQVISSEKLALACRVNPSQIRKDLAYFGEFGVRGVGYYVQELVSAIKESLGIDRTWSCALVGMGHMGKALLNHKEFARRGFLIKAITDCDPDKIGNYFSGQEVLCSKKLPGLVAELGLEIGLIATPPDRAQRAANYLVEAGIKGILNFAPARIHVPDSIRVEYVDFFHHLYSLAFHITLSESG